MYRSQQHMRKKIREESKAMVDSWQPTVASKILYWASKNRKRFLFREVPKFCKDRNLHQAILEMVREGYLLRQKAKFERGYIYTLVPLK